MPEQLVDIEKVSGAAAEIENARGWSIVQTELAHTVQVDSNPMFEIKVFRRSIAGIVDCVFAANLFEPIRVDRLDNGLGADANGKSPIAHDCTSVAPRAFEGFAAEDFSEFVGETQGRFGNAVKPCCQRFLGSGNRKARYIPGQ